LGLNGQKTKSELSKTLVEWAQEYFEENKAVLKLMGINNAEELQNRVLDLTKQYYKEKDKAETLQ
jgi:hypothetical protein